MVNNKKYTTYSHIQAEIDFKNLGRSDGETKTAVMESITGTTTTQEMAMTKRKATVKKVRPVKLPNIRKNRNKQ